MWLGALLCGKVLAFFSETVQVEGKGLVTEVDWQHFWVVPSAGVLLSLTVFVLFFHSRPQATLAQPSLLEGEVALPVSGEAGISPSLTGETEITPSTGG
jgi:hypothetical protein